MPFNLTGINNTNELNLTGKNEQLLNIPSKIKMLKKHILKNFIIPLYSEQWDILNKNKLLIEENIKQLKNYYKIYKLDDLLSFLELLHILKIVIDKNEILNDLENKHVKREKNNIINMVYKTTKIRLIPEYEIYNHIIGKPDRKLNETYDEKIISEIKHLMTQQGITYDTIEEKILASKQ